MVIGASSAQAGFIVRNGVVGQNGTGYGNIETIMSLQATSGGGDYRDYFLYNSV